MIFATPGCWRVAWAGSSETTTAAGSSVVPVRADATASIHACARSSSPGSQSTRSTSRAAPSSSSRWSSRRPCPQNRS